MAHIFDPAGGSISGNVTVGQGLGATVRVVMYGPDNHLIDTIAEVKVKDSNVPEYEIDKKKFAALSKFSIVHDYVYVGGGPGDFMAVTVFAQKNGAVVPPVSVTKTNSTGVGRWIEIIEFAAPEAGAN